MSSTAQLYAPAPDERRLFRRLGAGFAARASHAAEREQKVTVQDISAGGFRMSGCRNLATEMEVSVELAPLPRLPARVVWVVGHSAGCEFIRPLGARQLAAVIAENRSEAPRPTGFGRKGIG